MKDKPIPKFPRKRTFLAMVLTGALAIASFSCAGPEPRSEVLQQEDPTIETETRTAQTYTPPAEVEQLSAALEDHDYIIGPGDVLSLGVWRRPDVSSSKMIVGPDGIFTAPRIGPIKAGGRTREDVADEILEKLRRFYSSPEVTFSIDVYRNNKAFVLGRVENPGVVNFPGKGTLLEALSIAGGYSTEAEETYLTRCAIIRGKDTIIWIDLDDLLQNGNMALNAKIKNNDVIFIPEAQSELVYVMGEVYRPGVIPLTGRLTLMDALMMCGGPTKNANPNKIFLIRYTPEGKGYAHAIDLETMLASADFNQNYLLKDNDVLYVAETGMSKFNYALKQVIPSMDVMTMSIDLLESFGVMQEIRNSVWGQPPIPR